MRQPLPSHLGALREGWSLFRRHPILVLTLSLLAMVLAQMAPALELAARVSPSLVRQVMFAFVAQLPLEMYVLPRLLARLDAESLNRQGNPASSWRETFEQRWWRSFLAHLGLSVAAALGAMLFLVPGLVILTLFGWVPLRILLRGDDLMDALRWSQSAMARHWPRIVQAVLAVVLVALTYQLGAGWLLDRALPPLAPEQVPSAWLRLKHPGFWVFNGFAGALNLWVSCTLLALYHRLEDAVTHPLGEG